MNTTIGAEFTKLHAGFLQLLFELDANFLQILFEVSALLQDR